MCVNNELLGNNADLRVLFVFKKKAEITRYNWEQPPPVRHLLFLNGNKICVVEKINAQIEIVLRHCVHTVQ